MFYVTGVVEMQLENEICNRKPDWIMENTYINSFGCTFGVRQQFLFRGSKS
jgi:hypothetical protein